MLNHILITVMCMQPLHMYSLRLGLPCHAFVQLHITSLLFFQWLNSPFSKTYQYISCSQMIFVGGVEWKILTGPSVNTVALKRNTRISRLSAFFQVRRVQKS